MMDKSLIHNPPDELKSDIYFIEANHPVCVFHGPRSAMAARQKRDGGTFWPIVPVALAATGDMVVVETQQGLEEWDLWTVDADGRLVNPYPPPATTE